MLLHTAVSGTLLRYPAYAVEPGGKTNIRTCRHAYKVLFDQYHALASVIMHLRMRCIVITICLIAKPATDSHEYWLPIRKYGAHAQ